MVSFTELVEELIDLVIERDGNLPNMKRDPGDDASRDGARSDARMRKDDTARDLPDEKGGGLRLGDGFLTPESPFNTRFFMVSVASDDSNPQVIANSLARLSEEEMIQMTRDMIASDGQSGWADGRYRYRIQKDEDGATKAVFVDGFIQKASASSSLTSMALVFLILGLLFLAVVVIASSRAVQPLVESYERQKQFVTDASHELKTPLTLMLTNIDIARLATGANDWLEGADSGGRRMADLLS